MYCFDTFLQILTLRHPNLFAVVHGNIHLVLPQEREDGHRPDDQLHG